MTRQLLEEFSNVQKIGAGKVFSSDKIVEVLCHRKIASTEKAQALLEKYLTGELLSQQDVAATFGKDKIDASRTVKKFLEKLT